MRIDLHSQDTVPGEPPSAWAACSDKEAARQDQTIDGVRWGIPDDMPIAYASILDRPGLVEALRAEGYEVDDSWYFPL